MPTVPGSLSAPSLPKIPDTYLLMAAATMHEQGRLVEPAPRDSLDYSILENKVGKDKTDTIKWFDDYVKEPGNEHLQKWWGKRRQQEIDLDQMEKDQPIREPKKGAII